MWALLHAPMPMGDDYMQPNESVSLSGSIAVVTGGGRGIGQAIVTRLAAMDATVILTGRDEARVQQVARDLEGRGHRAEGIACDVTDLASVEALGERLRKSYGRVDILVNNAGIGGPSALDRKSTRLNSSHLGISY